MKNIFQVIKYSFLCITIMLSLLLFFDYIFIKYIIFSKEYSNFIGLKSEKINLQNVSKGVYLLKIKTDKETSINKIIIE